MARALFKKDEYRKFDNLFALYGIVGNNPSESPGDKSRRIFHLVVCLAIDQAKLDKEERKAHQENTSEQATVAATTGVAKGWCLSGEEDDETSRCRALPSDYLKGFGQTMSKPNGRSG